MFRILSPTVVLALFLASCGGSSNQSNNPVAIQGIAIPGSAYAGAVISARAADPNYPGSSIYFYDFGSGKVTELLATESRDPGVFVTGRKALVIHRGNTVPTIQLLDPIGSSPTTEPVAVEALAEGDPWDLAEISTGESETILLGAAPKAGGLVKILVPTSGGTQISSTAIAASLNIPAGATFRPTGLFRSGTKIFVNHQGLSVAANSAIANGSQSLFAFDISNPSAPVPTNMGRRGVASGLAVTGSAVQQFNNKKSGSPLLVSLCQEEMGSHCQSGVDRFDPATGSLSNITASVPLQSNAYQFFNRVIDGESERVVYVQSSKKDSGSKVLIRIDTTTGGVSEVHTYPDDRLYGAIMDDSTQTLLVGNFADLSGELKLYKNSSAVGSFALPAVPYAAALIPR